MGRRERMEIGFSSSSKNGHLALGYHAIRLHGGKSSACFKHPHRRSFLTSLRFISLYCLLPRYVSPNPGSGFNFRTADKRGADLI